MSAAGDPARAALDARVVAWTHESGWEPDEARFAALALELFAYQFDRCPAYARFCRARGVTPARVASWREIPAVPTGAFKELALRAFPEELVVHVFRTSGTSTTTRGALHLDSLAVYQASLRASFERFVLPELSGDERVRLRILAPSPDEAPDSSLSHMFGCVLDARGDAGSGFDVVDGRLDLDGLRLHLARACGRGVPVSLCGTAFAFVALLEALVASGERLALPPGSRVMETGGFKGRTRELSRAELHGAFGERLGVPASHVVNQYGMTELASQFYDSILREPTAPRRKLAPPWTRVRLLDPETGEEVGPGAIGRVAILDLANTGSVLAVQTADLGRQLADGFEVLGREPGAEARGCSLAAEAMLGGDAA